MANKLDSYSHVKKNFYLNKIGTQRKVENFNRLKYGYNWIAN